MSVLGKLLQAAVDVATVPVEMAKDVATLGGVITGEPEAYTAQRLRKLAEHLEEAYDELGEL